MGTMIAISKELLAAGENPDEYFRRVETTGFMM